MDVGDSEGNFAFRFARKLTFLINFEQDVVFWKHSSYNMRLKLGDFSPCCIWRISPDF